MYDSASDDGLGEAHTPGRHTWRHEDGPSEAPRAVWTGCLVFRAHAGACVLHVWSRCLVAGRPAPFGDSDG